VLAVGSAARHTADVPAVTALLLADHMKVTIYGWSTRRHRSLSFGWRLHAALDRRGWLRIGGTCLPSGQGPSLQHNPGDPLQDRYRRRGRLLA
jgi:hypothetical protein